MSLLDYKSVVLNIAGCQEWHVKVRRSGKMMLANAIVIEGSQCCQGIGSDVDCY